MMWWPSRPASEPKASQLGFRMTDVLEVVKTFVLSNDVETFDEFRCKEIELR